MQNNIVRTASQMTIVVAVMLIIVSCSPEKKGEGATEVEPRPRDTSAKFTQYYNTGEELYRQHCSNCHQMNGTGLGLLYPPLNKSDFMEQNLDAVLCLMRQGKSGELIVNGKSFNKKMPGIPALSDLEIAEIATYIYNTWEHDHGIVDVNYVSNAIQDCQSER